MPSNAELKRMRKIEKFTGANKFAKKFMDDRINPLTAGWMFNAWYEKIILVTLMSLGVWKLVELFI